MTKIQPHGPRQANCLFTLPSVSYFTGIKYQTLLKRYHRGALAATKYGGSLFVDYKEVVRLKEIKRLDDTKKALSFNDKKDKDPWKYELAKPIIY